MTTTNKVVLFILLFFFITGTIVTVFTPVFASSALIEDSWSVKTSMSQARADLGAVAVDGKIYVIGGYTTFSEAAVNAYYPSGYVGTNEQYDPITDTWVTLKPMPTPRGNFAIVAYQNKICCIGGGTNNNDGWISCDTVEIYDTITDNWSTKTAIPFDGVCIQANVIEGQIFVINRVYPDGGTSFYELYLYNPVADSWAQKASIPLPDDIVVYSDIFYTFSVVLDNKIMVYFQYMYGYWAFKGKVMIYDPKTDVWAEGGTPPGMAGSHYLYSATGSWATTGVFAPKNVYVLGLTTNDNWGQSNWVYTPNEDTWSPAKDMPTNRGGGFGVAVVDDILYVIGGSIASVSSGYFPAEISSLNEQYVPIGYNSTPLTSEQSINRSFSTELVAAVIVLMICVVVITLLFFFLRVRKGSRGIKHE
ncbi:MAG: hypothetical protein FWE56_04340 [Candidatus Bathyarchaeota archaeon]|nr:hypothetical protein [Candidatus Termiticorpusculum sp.]MCL2868794.1 hypothetical protein [Candidatus Termiticorpusculum sp.]